MTLAIKIGAGAAIYDNIADAFKARGTQKLSITGSGTELVTNMSDLTFYASGIGSIKSTSVIVMDSDSVKAN